MYDEESNQNEDIIEKMHNIMHGKEDGDFICLFFVQQGDSLMTGKAQHGTDKNLSGLIFKLVKAELDAPGEPLEGVNKLRLLVNQSASRFREFKADLGGD